MEADVNINLAQKWYALDSADSKQGPREGLCKHDNDQPLDSVKWGLFLNRPATINFSRKALAPLS
jgi:hypothetical protein